MSAQPSDPRPVMRSLLRDAWVAQAEQQIRRPRRDFRGPRHSIMVRIPEQLYRDLQAVANEAGLSLSDVFGVMAHAYLWRTGRVTR